MVGMVGLSSGLTPEWQGYALGYPNEAFTQAFGDLLDMWDATHQRMKPRSVR